MQNTEHVSGIVVIINQIFDDRESVKSDGFLMVVFKVLYLS